MVMTVQAVPETAPAVLGIGLLLLLAGAAGWLARRIGLPAVLGYLLVGLLGLPFSPGYWSDRRQLLVIAIFGLGSRPPLEAAGGIVGYLLVVVAAAWVLPRLLHAINAEHDLFLMLSVGSGLALAGLGARYLDVPLALAAFVSGLAIRERPAAGPTR